MFFSLFMWVTDRLRALGTTCWTMAYWPCPLLRRIDMEHKCSLRWSVDCLRWSECLSLRGYHIHHGPSTWCTARTALFHGLLMVGHSRYHAMPDKAYFSQCLVYYCTYHISNFVQSESPIGECWRQWTLNRTAPSTSMSLIKFCGGVILFSFTYSWFQMGSICLKLTAFSNPVAIGFSPGHPLAGNLDTIFQIKRPKTRISN